MYKINTLASGITNKKQKLVEPMNYYKMSSQWNPNFLTKFSSMVNAFDTSNIAYFSDMLGYFSYAVHPEADWLRLT
jgi:hypothetical protein